MRQIKVTPVPTVQIGSMIQIDRRLRPLASSLAALALVLGPALAASAAEPADVAAGRRLALRACGQCHATGPSGESAVADAPPFRRLNERIDIDSLPSRFKDGVMVSHSRMPMVLLDADELVQLTAYLKTLAPGPHKGSPARKG